MTNTMTSTEKFISPRVQSVAIVTAGFGQNVVLTTVTTFILLYLIQYAHISTAGIAVVSGMIFRESEHDRIGLGGTLPMQIFLWATGIMVVLFVVSWYLESYVIFYKDVRF